MSLLELAEELGNVSKACRIMGYYPDTFYKVAALAIKSGCEWITLDRDFAWFEGLRWQRPSRVGEC